MKVGEAAMEEGRKLVERMAEAEGQITAISDYRNAYTKRFCDLSRRIKASSRNVRGAQGERRPGRSCSFPTQAVDKADVDLHRDLLTAYKSSPNSNIDLVILQRLAKKLELLTISDPKQESLALHEMVVASDGDPEEIIEKMPSLLKKIKDFFMLIQHLQMGKPTYKIPSNERSKPPILPDDFRCEIPFDVLSLSDEVREQSQASDPEEIIEKMPSLLKKEKDFFMLTQHLQMGKPTYKIPSNERSKPPILPVDFRCPVSLELMKDPAIVSTRQTYDRESIEQWLEGHDTRPKTQQKLSNKSLTPNYVLHSHSTMVLGQWYRSPRHPAQLNQTKPDCSSPQHAKVIELVCKLSSRSIEDKRSTTVELHLLARLSAENRTVELRLLARLSAENHCCIAEAGAIPFLANLFSTLDVHTQENAVTAVLNLSILEENKENIGNKVKAARAGLVPILVGLLMDPKSTVLDETLAIVSVLSSHPEGKEAIKATEALPVLIDVIESGSPRTKENASATLVHLFSGDRWPQYLAKAQEKGLVSLLQEMTENGTN
ncbi:hypothetical protein ZIOFF_052737 [Zingiber officinale]|uniref:RING-type E3 ubiquitin transferase n=1 Tax=Zingiber officinale TaxID=94328 RepID=A0A8J5FMH6_ZINOF|nr:hypothetical protein ZIOFF_052737 [Zingiber officinale]